MHRLRAFGRSHPVVASLIGLGIVLLGTGAWAAVQLFHVEPVQVSFVVPTAERLTPAGSDETIYRIDASRSSVTYEVEESLAGVEHTATGSTSGIAGDIGIDRADPSQTRLGQVVVNVAQLTSDQALRDQRLQHDFLESQDHPLVTFDTTAIDGLPDSVVEGETYDVIVRGDLTVKETTAPVDLDASVRIDGDVLRITATTTVLLSTFDVGPINLIGFVSTGDEARLTFELVAVDTASAEAPTEIAAPTREEALAAGPSFASTVQPVLEANCASCHNDGGVGSDHWLLDDAGDAAEVAPGLGLVVGAGFMPPWPASEEGIALKHSMALDPEEIDAVVAWAEAGGPLDVDPATAIEAPAPSAELAVDGDLELSLTEPYVGSLDERNDYRCFVLDPELTEPTAVAAFDFVPDEAEVVHHALAFRLSSEARTAAEASDEASEGSGYACGATPSGTGGRGSSTQFMAWAPGQLPTRYPDGSGLLLEPGDAVLVQIHYHFSHSTPPDQSTLVLELADEPPDELDPVRFTTYLAPAEIPCGPDEEGPLCDRDAMLDELVEQFGPLAPAIANGMHLMCGTSVDEVAVLDGTVASASCDHRIAVEGEVLSIFGHMHEIGKRFTMTLNPGTPEEQVLLDIPAWDFNWQLDYEPATEVYVERGDVLRVECSWDRSLLLGQEPRYVTWAEGTEDEMCYSALTTRSER